MLHIRLPERLQKEIQEWAKADGISVEQFVSEAAAEKLNALRALQYLRGRAKRGSRKKFEAVLRTVPDVEPPKYDRLPSRVTSRRSNGNGPDKR